MIYNAPYIGIRKYGRQKYSGEGEDISAFGTSFFVSASYLRRIKMLRHRKLTGIIKAIIVYYKHCRKGVSNCAKGRRCYEAIGGIAKKLR